MKEYLHTLRESYHHRGRNRGALLMPGPFESIFSQWEVWSFLVRTRDYINTSVLYAYFEQPILTVLWWGWPWLHVALALVLTYFTIVVSGAASKCDEYSRTKFVGVPALLWTYAGLASFVLAGTLAGSHLHEFKALYSADPTLIPKTMPPRPTAPQVSGPGGWSAADPRYTRYRAPQGPRLNATYLLQQKAAGFLTSLDFMILLTPLLLVFIAVVGSHLHYFFFAFAYARENARPHLPTEIVDRALAGSRIDGRALADAMTPSTAPVLKDSLADKVERERLAALAARLKTDASALNDKLTKEAEIARLVVSHARKREELADMEQKLRDMGVQKHG